MVRLRGLALFLILSLGCTNGILNSGGYYSQSYSIDFNSYSTLSLGSMGFFMAFGDFQNNGSIDYAVPIGSNVTVSTNNGFGSFSLFQNPAAGSTGRGVVTADFNGDGYLDLVSVSSGANQIQRYDNLSGSSFSAGTTYGITAASNAQEMKGADFDQDGDIDLAIAQLGVNNVCVLTNSGSGAFSVCTNLSAANNPTRLLLADFNNDGDMDIAVTKNASSVATLLGSSGMGFAAEVSSATTFVPSAFDVADFDSDGKKDLLVSYLPSSNVAFLKGNGDGTFQAAVNVATGPSNNNYIAAGDLDGDGYQDFVLINDGAGAVNVYAYKGYGNGTFSGAMSFPHAACTAANNIYLKDVNADGRLDIIVICRTPNSVSVFLHK